MLPQDLERTLERYGYERLRYPKYVLVRSETPLREGDFFSPLRPVLKVLPDGTATLNHEGEGSHVGITYSQKFATMAYCLAVFGYKSFNQFNMKINDELRAVTVARMSGFGINFICKGWLSLTIFVLRILRGR